MKHQEKKYRVNSFDEIQKKLEEAGAKGGKEIITTHYYTHQDSNNVVKLVKYDGHNEIHILEESNGKYSLKERIAVEDTDAGFQWLKDKGYKVVDVVKMAYTDYEYRGGIIGLYTINDFLYSVILDFPEGQQRTMEKEFGLNNTEVIDIPYNKYLEKISKLQSIDLS